MFDSQPAPSPAFQFPTSDFLGIPLCTPTLDEFIEDVIEMSYDRSRTKFVTYINAHCVNLYHGTPEYHRILDTADYIYADGMSVVKAANQLGIPTPERLSAAHFFEQFCKRCGESDRKLFFVGSKRHQVSKAAETLVAKIKGLRVIGYHHGFFEYGLDEEKQLFARIHSLQPDILVVGMGVPRQELWVYNNIDRLGVPVAWCVGALFEYESGYRSLAPDWVSNMGYEWLFRLMLEPKRLWYRYLVGNPLFMKRVRKELKRRQKAGNTK